MRSTSHKYIFTGSKRIPCLVVGEIMGRGNQTNNATKIKLRIDDSQTVNDAPSNEEAKARRPSTYK